MRETIPDEVYDKLATVYMPTGCVLWWNSTNRNLQSRRPKDMWEEGYRDEVWAEVERVVGGM